MKNIYGELVVICGLNEKIRLSIIQILWQWIFTKNYIDSLIIEQKLTDFNFQKKLINIISLFRICAENNINIIHIHSYFHDVWTSD